MYGYTGNNWGHRNSNKSFKEKFRGHTRKMLNRFTTTDSCTWNVTRNTGSTAVGNLNLERWGSPMVKDKCQEEKGLCVTINIIMIKMIIMMMVMYTTRISCVIAVNLRILLGTLSPFVPVCTSLSFHSSRMLHFSFR